MKRLYTSNYARSGEHPLSYAISAKPPEWYRGKRFSQLAPTWEMINDYKSGKITKQQYADQYIELLRVRNIASEDVVDAFPDGTRFLCYEKRGEFCHRRVLAEWIERETGVIVPEFISEEQQKRDELADDLLDF